LAERSVQQRASTKVRQAPARRLASLALLSGAALGCFAANSLLARAALGSALADPASFTALRIVSGAGALTLILAARRKRPAGGSFSSAAALLGYAAAFSFAYVRIPAGVGALLLFTSVQVTMLGIGVAQGARPSVRQWAGVAVALAGLAYLTGPGANRPDALGAVLMVAAGASWGVYSLHGRAARDPLATTGDNFVRASALAVPLAAAVLLAQGGTLTWYGGVLAVASGALASAGGYSLWYAVMPTLGATRAAALQVTVPAIAAVGGVVLLSEPLTVRLVLSAAVILVGVVFTLSGGARRAVKPAED
jgi:drug/metabolite transporter (DMT)-like permease